ncbi:hypothetical protein K1719_023902 [Acacia pycnantha]|nr:hypothetical protein K1719_023902 [Acacia pycnantha]
MKLRWNLVVDKEALWISVLKAKYAYGDKPVPDDRKRSNSTSTRKAICVMWETFLRGLGKKIDDVAPINANDSFFRACLDKDLLDNCTIYSGWVSLDRQANNSQDFPTVMEVDGSYLSNRAYGCGS